VAVSWVGGIFQDAMGFLQAAGVVEFSQGGEGASDYFLSGVHDPLERLPLCSRAAPEPHTDAVCQDALNRAPIE